MDSVLIIFNMIFPGAIVFACTSFGLYFMSKDKIVRYPSKEWLSLKDHPIPENVTGIIVTDGSKVDFMYSLKWAPYGKIYFNQNEKKYVTHWMPLPEAPSGKNFLTLIK